MTKKAFTIVELIAIVTILAVMALVVFPSLVGIQKNSEEKRKEETLKDIYMATESYLILNYDECEQLDDVGGICYIYINTLINKEYISADINNPITDEVFKNDDVVKIIRNEDSTFSYELTRIEE